MVRNAWISILALVMATSLFAQEEPGTEKARPMDRLILELSNDGWQSVPEGIELRPYSPGFSVFLLHDYPILRENFSFAWGYGISSHNVHHNGQFVKTEEDGIPELTPYLQELNYLKNKSSATYADFCAEFRIRSNGRRRAKLFLGAKAGFLVNFHHKYKDARGTSKFKYREDVLPYRYGLNARLGYGRLGISAFYGLSALMEEGFELKPLSVGLYLSL